MIRERRKRLWSARRKLAAREFEILVHNLPTVVAPEMNVRQNAAPWEVAKSFSFEKKSLRMGSRFTIVA